MGLEEFRAARTAGKRADILAAARTRFAADGFDRTSVEAIASDAKVSTATLYRAFSSKMALFAAVIEAGMAQFEDRLTTATGGSLLRVATGYAELLADPEVAGLIRAMLAEAGRNRELGAIFYGVGKTFVASTFESAVQAAVVAEEIAMPAALVERASGQLMGMIEHAILWRQLLHNGAEPAPTDAIAGLAVETFRRAYAKAQG